jgi:UDP-N-acetylmuramoyl-L-alanyl-D-glutamate--2,6-diaminopimelate ligase
MMGAVATELADFVFVTTDNARSEDPATIAAEITGGAVRTAGLRVVLDRREAIDAAIEMAGSGDVVVVAGKGHERGQVLATVTHDFDDMEEARAAVLRKQGGAA